MTELGHDLLDTGTVDTRRAANTFDQLFIGLSDLQRFPTAQHGLFGDLDGLGLKLSIAGQRGEGCIDGGTLLRGLLMLCWGIHVMSPSDVAPGWRHVSDDS